jgi:hypothetical protein
MKLKMMKQFLMNFRVHRIILVPRQKQKNPRSSVEAETEAKRNLLPPLLLPHPPPLLIIVMTVIMTQV